MKAPLDSANPSVSCHEGAESADMCCRGSMDGLR